MRRIKDLTNQKFGRLTLVSRCENTGTSKNRPSGYSSYLVRCDCGKTVKAKLNAMKSGNTLSCGCLASEATSRSNKKTKTTHGMSGHQSFSRWWNMNRRCLDKDSSHFESYGGRGIMVWWHWSRLSGASASKNFCEWLDSNLGQCPDGHSLDRIDNNRGYMPDNLRWANDVTQANNKRNSK